MKASAPANDPEGSVVNLMEALKRSLEGKGAPKERATKYLEAASKKKPARKPRRAA